MSEIDEAFKDSRPMILKLAESQSGIARQNRYEPAFTLGFPKKDTKNYKEAMAMDACCRNVLSGALKSDLAFSAFPMFVGYGFLSNLSQEGLIRAGVETIADDMTRKSPELFYDDDGNEKEENLITKINTELVKFKVRDRINSALLKDGYFGGCLVYIDVGDLEDDEAEEPLSLDTRTFKKGSLRGFKVIEPVNIAPGTYNTTDPTSEDYFNPEWYYVLGRKYHKSHFLYFASNETPLLLKAAYNFFGIPQAQLALDYVAHFVANRESAQQLLNKFSLTCFGTDMSQGLRENGSWADLVKRMKMFNKLKDNNGTFVYNKETEELSQINTPLGGVRDIVDMSLNLLTAIWRIPKIRYIGEGEGGINASSTEQMRSYYDYINAMQEKVLTTPFETILKVIQLNLGLEPDEKLMFRFPNLWDLNEKERADLNKVKADTAAVYISNGVLSQEECRRSLSMDRNSGYTMIDAEDVPEPVEEPLKDVDKEEQDEEDRQAMDEKWITIKPNGEENVGRHILLDGQESPKTAIERTYNIDLDKKERLDNDKSDKEYVGEYIEINGKKRPTKNSEGKQIAKTEKELRAFYDWFGNSKVVDENGRPLVVYHSTTQEFNKFDKRKQRKHEGRSGFWFSSVKSDFGKTGKSENKIIPVYLSASDVFVVDAKGKNWYEIGVDSNLYPEISESAFGYKENGDTANADMLSAYAKNKNYTGLIIKNVIEGDISGSTQKRVSDDFVVFEPNQIKSVENKGTFSKESDVIYDEKIAMDFALTEDGRWITIGAREKGENGEDDEGRKGRHIYLDNGETPEEAISELKKENKKEEKTQKENSTRNVEKTETKPSEKSEKVNANNNKEKQNRIKKIVENGEFGKLNEENKQKIKEALLENFKDFEDVSDIIADVGSIQGLSKKAQKEALEINKEKIESVIKETEARYMGSWSEEELIRSFGSVDAFKKRVRTQVENRVKKAARTIAGRETAHFSWNTQTNSGSIRFNENIVNDSMFSFKQELCQRTKYHPENCVGIKSTTDHEFGHAIERYILEKNRDAESYKKLYGVWQGLSPSEIEDKLSRYAATNFSEFIAEGYCEYRNNKPPRELAKQIGELLTQAYKEAKNG